MIIVIDVKFVTTTLKTTVSTLLIAMVWLWSFKAVAQTTSTPKYIAQSFNGIVEGNLPKSANNFDGKPRSNSDLIIVQPSKRAAEISFETYSGSVDRREDRSSSDWETKTINPDWFDPHQGESFQHLIRIVIWRF